MATPTIGESIGTAIDRFLTVTGLLPLSAPTDLLQDLARDATRVNQPINQHTQDRLLHLASAKGSLEIVTLLLQHGADVNALGESNRTPLHCAASAGNVPVCEELLNHGANLEAIDDKKDTPLFSAIRGEKWDAAKFLEGRGARVDLNAAVCLGQMDRVREMLQDPAAYQTARLPQELLADAIRYLGRNRIPKPKEGEDQSEAISAVLAECRWFVERLLELGAEANAPGALEQAVQMPDTEIARLLLERGASVDRGGVWKNLVLAMAMSGKEMREMAEGYRERHQEG